MSMSGCNRVHVKSARVDGLDASLSSEGLFVTFHSIDELNNTGTEIGRTGISKGETEWEFLQILSTTLEMAVVLRTVSETPLGYSRIRIDPDLPLATVSAPVMLELPTFSIPTITVNVACIHAAHFAFVPKRVVAGEVSNFGSVICVDGSRKFALEMGILKGSRILQSALSPSIVPRVVQSTLVVEPPEPLRMVAFIDPADWDKLAVEVRLVDQGPDSSTALVDTIKLSRVKLDSEPIQFGYDGALLVSRAPVSNQGLRARIRPVNDFFVKQEKFSKFAKLNWKVSIHGMPSVVVGGFLTYAVTGYGDRALFNTADVTTVPINGYSTIVSGSAFMAEDVPMLGICIRNTRNELCGLYSLPLVDAQLQFLGEAITMHVETGADENTEPIILPRPRVLPGCYIKEKCTTRIYCTVESATRLPKVLESVVVVLRTVSLCVPPPFLGVNEVLHLQMDDECLSPAAVATTTSRDRTANPIWRSDLEIDVKWNKSDYLYFLIYDNNATYASTTLVGQSCLSVDRVTKEAGRFSLPVLQPNGASQLGESFISVSFPKEPIPWCPIFITQPTGQHVPYGGEVSLHVSVHRSHTDRAVIREHHMWLPINGVYPLALYDCPPAGFLTMRLSPLSGSTLARSSYRFGMRSCDSMTCGGIKFHFSRIEA